MIKYCKLQIVYRISRYGIFFIIFLTQPSYGEILTRGERHAAVSAMSTLILHDYFKSKKYRYAMPLAVGLVLGVAVAKELTDPEFNTYDMQSNALGVGAGFVFGTVF